MAKTYLFWDPLSDNILQERESGALVAEYTGEPGLYGNVISQSRGGVESQFHYDAVGSTLAVTGNNQQVTDTRAYSGFGERTQYAGTIDFPFEYKGYWWNGVSGDYLVGERRYDPRLSMWLSAKSAPTDRPKLRAALEFIVNPFLYSLNNPQSAFASRGLQGVQKEEDDGAHEFKDSLGDDEKKFLKTYCNCKVEILPTPGKETQLYAWVGCDDGKMVVRPNILNPDARKRIEQWAKCGFDKCVLIHEQHHILQAELLCPDACKGKTCPAFSTDPPNPRGFAYVVTFNAQCGPKVECWALGAELACAFMTIEENKKAGKAECRGITRDYLSTWEDLAKKFRCGIPRDVQERIDKEKRG